MRDLLARIQKKKAKLEALRPLPKAVLQSLQKNLAVEWTYNSNAIEGNTLSLRETKLVLEEGMTIKGKSLREHFEAKNHEAAITFLNEWIAKKKPLSERFVMDIHALVLRGIEEDFAGRYRTGQVRITGANFIPPAGRKVPDHMEQYFVELKKLRKKQNLIEFISWLHHRFVWIHPFYDGNGRTARLVMNLALMQDGHPPAIILKNDRKKYYDALNKANNDDYSRLHLLIGQAIERSLDLYLSAVAETDDEEYVRLAELAPNTPYSAEYLGLLARRGLIDAYKDSRNWYSNKKAIDFYISNKHKK